MSIQIAPSKFSQDWYEKTAIIFGNGPSLLGAAPEEFARPNSVTLVCNGGYARMPRADLLVATDKTWLAAETAKPEPFKGYEGPEILITRPEVANAYDLRMRYVRRVDLDRWRADHFRDPGLIVEGWTSVTTMIATAVHRGAGRIVLLGLDLAPGADGRRSVYDDRRDPPATAARRYMRQIKHLTIQAAQVRKMGVEVINCSPRSKLDCYPYADWKRLYWPRGWGVV